MIDRILASLIGVAVTRRRTLIVFALLGALLSTQAMRVPLDFSFAGVMDRSHPEVARYFAASEAYGLGGILPLLVEGQEESLDEAVEAVRLALRALPEVRSVDRSVSKEWVLESAPWLVSAEQFDAWMEAVQDPNAEASGPMRLTSFDELFGRFTPRVSPGARLVQVVMARDTFEMALNADDFPTIRRVTQEVLSEYGASGSFAGMPAIVTQEQEATIDRMSVLGPLSLALVLLILWSVERRWLILVSIAVPMLLAVGCTLALIGLIAGELTLMESIFGVMVFGLGIDFAIHLLLRLREEKVSEPNIEVALRRAFVGTGRGVVAGALTTAGAFFILAFAPDPVFYRLGLSGGLGLTLCLVFLLLLLPAEWAWIERRFPETSTPKSLPDQRGLGRLAGTCARNPVPALLISGLVLVVGGIQLRSLAYETNLERVFSRDIEAVDTARRIDERFGIHPGVWLVPTVDLEEARAVGDAFEDDPLFEKVESLATLIPADAARRAEVLAAWAETGAGTAQGSSTRESAPTSEAGAGAAIHSLAPMLWSAYQTGPPTLDALPESLRSRWVGPADEVLVFAYTREATLDSEVAAAERRAAQGIHPAATSMNAIYEALIGTDRPWMPPILLSVLAFIAIVLRIDLGSTRWTLLALVPPVFAGVVTLGLLSAFGFSLNTVTLVGIPLLLGLGVDDGIHVVHRMIEQPEARVASVVGSVASSIAVTTATTCGSVGLLLFSRHPGIESIAILLLVGLPAALLATVTVLPAAAIALGVSSRG